MCCSQCWRCLWLLRRNIPLTSTSKYELFSSVPILDGTASISHASKTRRSTAKTQRRHRMLELLLNRYTTPAPGGQSARAWPLQRQEEKYIQGGGQEVVLIVAPQVRCRKRASEGREGDGALSPTHTHSFGAIAPRSLVLATYSEEAGQCVRATRFSPSVRA
jgi:hypothetical protein